MPEHVLITGGAGFIGSAASEKLCSAGKKVTIIDKLDPQIHGKDPYNTSFSLQKAVAAGAEIIEGDILDRELLKKALCGVDCVLHLAAATGTGQSMYAVYDYVQNNVSGTANLLDVIMNENNNVEKVVLSSSRAVYGEGAYRCKEHGILNPGARNVENMKNGIFECLCTYCSSRLELIPTPEDIDLDPLSLYGLTKKMQEELFINFSDSTGMEYTILRYQNVYGPGQSLSNPYTGILSIFSGLLLNGKKINIFEDGLESRDFIHIDDIAEITVKSLEKGTLSRMVANAGTGIGTSVLDVVKTMAEAFGVKEEYFISGHFRKGDIRHNIAEISKTKKELKKHEYVSFSKGVRNFCKWVKLRESKDNTAAYERSLEELKRKKLLNGF